MPFAVKLLVALAAFLVIYLLAVRVIRVMLRPPPPEAPDPSTLRPVDYHYRCTVCGAEVTMTAAPGDEVPEPPRHCREDMALVGETSG